MIPTAWAHRDRGPDDPCRKQIGDSLLHLTLYQPHFDPDAEYCEEVPRAGKTVVVVDVTAGELRQVPIAVEMTAQGASGQARSVLSLPAQMLNKGVIDSEVVFEEGNTYSAQVVVDLGAGKEVHKFSFPIQVLPWYTAMVKPTLMVVGLFVVMAVSVIRYQISSRRQQREEASVGKRKIRRVAN
ncbi:MAG: hypothetical protein FJ147_22515 [Deltaproteobacteria bacterium]|nr:hypothetical protein [Deltaproteobacteria bacterium]